ncbi:hypothetical protein N9Y42_08300 [Mariniblastus sp.]|nr:hypothetical protein [Mariniblastus sp.]
MRVSVRLKGIWASALIASFTVVQAPASTYGQTQTAPAVSTAATAVATPAAPTMVVGDANIDEAAKQVLLRARQALAQSDLMQAESLLKEAAQMPANFEALGDSPATIQALVNRQNQLVGMAQGQHPEYNAGAASFFLVQAEALMYYQDFDGAETLIKHARSFDVQFNEKIGDPDRLEKLLEISRASLPKQAPAMVADNDATMQLRKLISQSQLAFDRGQYNEAQALILDAKKLNVDETQFAADQMRTWQMELKIQKVLGAATALAAETKVDPQVEQASHDVVDDENVFRADYDPANDTTKVVQIGFTDDKQATSSNFAPIPSNPMEYYRAGLKAIADQDLKEARNYLIRAWEGRQQLDDVTQQSIQDQLARLNMKNEATSQRATADLQGRDSNDIEAFRQLQSEVFRERVKIDKLLEEDPRAALERMAMVRNRIGQSKLDASQQSPLLKMIDRDMEEVQQYIEENILDIDNADRNKKNLATVERRQQRRQDVDRQMQGLVEDYNQLIDEQRFAEAELIAAQAIDLDPDSVISVLLFEKVKLQKRIVMDELIEEAKQASFLDGLESVKRASIATVNTENPTVLGDRDMFVQNGQRRAQRLEQGRYGSEAEARIWNQLRNERVQGDYRGTLKDALDQLAQTAGVNIIIDELALSDSSIPIDSQVDIPIISPISLKSALDIILSQKRLVFQVENEVIKITTPQSQKSNLRQETYYIGDLVMPLDTPRDPMAMEWMSPNRSFGAMGSGGSMNVQNVATSQAPNQLAMAQNFGGGLPGVGNPMGNNGYSNGPQRGEALYSKMGQRPLGGVTLNDFQPLLNLIRSTIDSESWGDGEAGGTSSISPYAQNLSIVVSAPQETQDKVQNLLKKLRELNDVQIVVEVRFVTLQDDFFERVGIDFDFSLEDNTGGAATNALGDNVLVNGGSGIVGADPSNTTPFTPTTDFDLGFLQSNFTAATPLFGGDISSAATFGFAILSDIEVFFLLQAGKSNTRTNITQAPTVTMFNGQSASVSDFAQRPFVTSVIPVVGDFAVAHQPIITLLPDGTNLNVQAVVTSDRQFVKLRLVPYFTQVTEVSTFTFNGSQQIERTTNSVLDDLLNIVDGTDDGPDAELLTSTTGITIQLPVLAVTNVSTVVSVPDGGTVLMGGIKRMQEGRSEAGVPFLSNIPYVNRLFKNVGIGHETSHLMMMVTPRIIIQKEIEEDAVGGRDN